MWLMKRFLTTLPSILSSSQISRRTTRAPKPDAKQPRTNMSAEDFAAIIPGTDTGKGR